MKTLSQNTTSSACAPETDLQQLVATLVPDEQRISFWPQHFGLIPQWVTLEPRVFGWMDRLCEDYCGGIWNLYTLNNGGAFMAPEPDDDDDETWVLFNAMNGIRGRFRDADAYPLDQAFPLLMKQLKLMLTSGELNPRHQHTVTLYAKGLTCEADTLGSCGYVYLAVYPTPETKK
ncbi:type IV toxin-antitoxin system YeeU family antitoxin [Escherichia coli]|nr:type IV toxin-antitoxin system YeeU family antitoxin [Escherichia coli]